MLVKIKAKSFTDGANEQLERQAQEFFNSHVIEIPEALISGDRIDLSHVYEAMPEPVRAALDYAGTVREVKSAGYNSSKPHEVILTDETTTGWLHINKSLTKAIKKG